MRAAVAAGVNITYKLLYNGAVAMTGGQDPQGAIAVPELAQMLLLEGCERVIITTEDVGRYDAVPVPDGVAVWDRSRVVEAQEVLAKVPGVTVLIHDQACAAESRRGRKRGTVATPAQRVVINERVCEGCGDCGVEEQLSFRAAGRHAVRSQDPHRPDLLQSRLLLPRGRLPVVRDGGAEAPQGRRSGASPGRRVAACRRRSIRHRCRSRNWSSRPTAARSGCRGSAAQGWSP